MIDAEQCAPMTLGPPAPEFGALLELGSVLAELRADILRSGASSAPKERDARHDIETAKELSAIRSVRARAGGDGGGPADDGQGAGGTGRTSAGSSGSDVGDDDTRGRR
jgi:hypothetical protein